MDDRLVSIGEAAKALGVSVDTIRRWERDGRLHSQRDSRNRRTRADSSSGSSDAR